MKIYKSLGQNFVIHYKQEGNWIDGKVYDTINWTDMENKKGWSYASRSCGGEMHESLNKDCRCLFEFKIIWRGCWDNRIYFKEDEYFAEELEEMLDYWKEIEKLLEEEIASNSEYKEQMEKENG